MSYYNILRVMLLLLFDTVLIKRLLIPTHLFIWIDVGVWRSNANENRFCCCQSCYSRWVRQYTTSTQTTTKRPPPFKSTLFIIKYHCYISGKFISLWSNYSSAEKILTLLTNYFYIIEWNNTQQLIAIGNINYHP